MNCAPAPVPRPRPRPPPPRPPPPPPPPPPPLPRFSSSPRPPVPPLPPPLPHVVLGAVSLGKLPVSLLPDVSLLVLTVRTRYTGAAAEEVSRFVAEPIEEAIAATPVLVELRSVSRNGEAMTTAHFAWGTDMQAT